MWLKATNLPFAGHPLAIDGWFGCCKATYDRYVYIYINISIYLSILQKSSWLLLLIIIIIIISSTTIIPSSSSSSSPSSSSPILWVPSLCDKQFSLWHCIEQPFGALHDLWQKILRWPTWRTFFFNPKTSENMNVSMGVNGYLYNNVAMETMADRNICIIKWLYIQN